MKNMGSFESEAAKRIDLLEKKTRKLAARNVPDTYKGYTNIPVLPAYATAISVTFTGIDLTAYFTIGVKCAWYQSAGWRYGYVLSSSYGSGNTTLNFVPNTSHDVANTTISIFKISYAVPPDFVRVLAYTPIITAFSGSFTSVSSSGTFQIDGRTLNFSMLISITTNGTAGTFISATLPVVGYGYFVFAGRNTTAGTMLQGVTHDSNSISILTYNNGYPGADATTLNMSGTIQI